MNEFNLGSELRVYDIVEFQSPNKCYGIYAGKSAGTRFFEVLFDGVNKEFINDDEVGIAVKLKRYKPSNMNRFWGYSTFKVRLIKSNNGIKPSKSDISELFYELYRV